MHFTPQVMQMKPNSILNLVYLLRFNLKTPTSKQTENQQILLGFNKKKLWQARMKLGGAASAERYKLWSCRAPQPVKSFTQSG